MTRGPGRPTKFTPQLGALLIAEIRGGAFLDPLARRHGVSPYTVRDWVRRGFEEGAPEDLAAFSDAYTRADAEWENDQRKLLDRAARTVVLRVTKEVETTDSQGNVSLSTETQRKQERGDARVVQWLLHKKYPKRYGDEKTAQLGANESLPLSELQQAATDRPDDLDELLSDPPAELEEALLRNKDRLLALLSRPEPSAAKKP